MGLSGIRTPGIFNPQNIISFASRCILVGVNVLLAGGAPATNTATTVATTVPTFKIVQIICICF